MSDVNEKLDKIISDITDIKVTQAEMKVNVAYHISRSDNLEENVDMLRKEFKPVKAHVTFMNTAAKILAGAGAILVFLQTMGWLKLLLGLGQ